MIGFYEVLGVGKFVGRYWVGRGKERGLMEDAAEQRLSRGEVEWLGQAGRKQ